MSSILTNNSAMVALDTLRNINKNLSDVQSEISTGKKISSAKDNSAIWAVSTTMSTDVESFKQITDSLNLGSSTVGVARSAAEEVTENLQDMKNLIVAAQESNVDRTKFQTEITALKDQITSIVGAAQFNGLNLIDGSSSADVKILSSLNRSPNGTVSTSTIDVARQDLSISNTGAAQTFGATDIEDGRYMTIDGTDAIHDDAANSVAAGSTMDVVITGAADGASYRIIMNDTAAADSLGSRTFEYVASASDSAEAVASNLANQINNFLDATGETKYSVAVDGDTLTFSNAASPAGALALTAQTSDDGSAGVQTGGLGNLANIDVTSDAGATSALTQIEGLLKTSIDAAAAFGSAQTRIENQGEFVNSLVDSMTSGIGALVDADMEAASAKLQALQVQQQLGTQALSIANQAPQSLLSLFR